MSNPSNSGASDSAGRKPIRLPEKSNFAQTCHLLSQFLKEKRSLGMNPMMEPKEEFQTSRPPAIMNLLTNLENPEQSSKEKASASTNGQSMGFLPQLAKMEPPSVAQMTIFYGGNVLVFNDLPPERAEEIMAMAGTVTSFSRSAATVSDKVIEPAAENAAEQLHGQPQTKPSGDLPIARRASLHRFFEKRKDRVAARAPYQVNPPQNSISSKAGESYNFNNYEERGNHQSSKQFDLNL